MSIPLKTLLFLSGILWSFSLFGQSPVETYDSTKSYSVGALVLVGEESYIATQASTDKNPPDNSDVWTNLSVAASALGKPVEEVPELSTSEILNSLPGSTPPGSDGDSSSSVRLYGISTSATVTPTDMMVAGIDVKGGTKKVVFQVQANGTYPNSGYVTNPILYVTNSAGTVIATVDDWASGPTSFDATYYQASYLTELTSSRFAMNGSKEAAIVMNLPEGTYTALVGSNGETAKAVVAAFEFE